jgi:hypothetical protein
VALTENKQITNDPEEFLLEIYWKHFMVAPIVDLDVIKTEAQPVLLK